MKMKFAIGVAALAVLVPAATVTWAHVNHQEGGPHGDVLDGHAHGDVQRGRGGCDDLLGRDGSDDGWGGDSGCDTVRGMTGGADAAIVCDDGAGNDWAYGGGGLNDLCYFSLSDSFDRASCEVPRLSVYNC
jgi:hypothetical protein